MRINTNVSALNTHRQMTNNTNAATKSMEKLSSGLRINRAGDDAAGLSISEKMRSQIAGLDQASKNAQDGISYIQTAEGALTEVSSMLTRMKELTVQMANGTYNADDKANINLELGALSDEINNIFDNTKFNGIEIFDDAAADVNIVITHDAATDTELAIEAATLTKTRELDTKINRAQPDQTQITAADVDAAISEINTQRAVYGSQQNRLEHTINNLGATSENLSAAESRIRDTDMAKEMMEFTKNNILSQAAQSMLAQANQQPQNVLSLLR